MTTFFVLAVLVTAPPPKTESTPLGVAPRIEHVQPAADGKIRMMARVAEEITVKETRAVVVNGVTKTEVVDAKRNIYRNKELSLDEMKDLKITTTTGTEVSAATAVEKLVRGGTIVVSADGKPVDPTYLRAFKDDVLVLVSDNLVLPARTTLPSATTTRVLPAIKLNAKPVVIPPALPVPAPKVEEKKVEKKEENK